MKSKFVVILNKYRSRLPIRAYVTSANARVYYWCLGITLLWRIGLECINQAIVPIMTPGPGTSAGAVALKAGSHGISRWASTWDGAWYGTITQHGYVVQHHFKSYESIVFFPLFPYLVRWLSEATRLPYKAIGLVLNVFLTSLIAFFLYKLTVLMAAHRLKSEFDATALGKLAVVCLLLNPSSFFFAAYYAEALLVLLVTAAVYFAYKDKLLLAALLAGLATATKSIGLVTLPTILLLYTARHEQEGLLILIKRKWITLVAACLLSLSGLVTYMLYLWIRFGDPLIFIKVEKYWNRNVSGFFLQNIWQVWYQKLFSPHYYAPASNYLYSLFLMAIPPAILTVVAYLILRHRLRFLWLACMCLLALFIPLTTGILISLNRYVLILTPLICYLCVYVYPQSMYTRRLFLAIMYLSSVIMTIFTLVFLSFRFAG